MPARGPGDPTPKKKKGTGTGSTAASRIAKKSRGIGRKYGKKR